MRDQNMPVSVRQATGADDEVVGELLVRAFVAQYAAKHPDIVLPPERLADLRDQAEKRTNATVLVAEIDGRIVGTVSLYKWGAPRSEAWIPGAPDLRLLGVDVGFHGQGLSTILMEQARQLAMSWGAPAICLHIRRGVVGVARLYVSLGYVRDESGDIDLLPLVFLEGYVLRL